MVKITLVCTIIILFVNYRNVASQPAGCTCVDEQPQDTPRDCADLARLGLCGTSTTRGDRYCRCSCGLCNATDTSDLIQLPPPVPSPSLPVAYAARQVANTAPEPTPRFSTTAQPAYFEQVIQTNALGLGAAASYQPQIVSSAPSVAAADTIGFTVGGAMGIESFRRNIEEDYLPLPQDLTYEGIFNEYFFDTSDPSFDACNQLFCPKYSAAITPDPLFQPQTNEYYLAVGLDSGLATSDFGRKRLNLVILLDISGSMSSPFDQYAYDGPIDEEDDYLWAESKLEVAKTAVIDLLKHLRNDDRLSIVTFDSTSDVVRELTLYRQVEVGGLQEEIGRIQDGGSTNLESGYRRATQQLTDCFECMGGGLQLYENRIIILTDAQANTGDFSDSGLAALVSDNSNTNSIFTTVIGIGLDFNSELIEALTKTRGANYFSVYSPTQFRQKLDDGFEFLVTPLVFDLKLEIDPASFDNGNGWQVIKVYGSPNIDGGLTEEGTLIEINTLFPSPKTEEGIKGGVVLLKLYKPDQPVPLKLKVSYIERDRMQAQSSEAEVKLFDEQPDQEFYGSTGVHKAVVLSRYVDLLRGWLIDENQKNQVTVIIRPIYIPIDYCHYYPSTRYTTYGDKCEIINWCLPVGPILPVYDFIIVENMHYWERTSMPLTVTQEQGDAFNKFLPYLQSSIEELGDSTMQQESEILSQLIEVSGVN
eukprot:TRINITY_DN2757_c0_g1_i5.p1 TRINITY_DN2757_c0_g1~~TRINITY_DN2757_c0_g1_i5.p1  ORF type:complete len:739 (+),score=77.94 TRINITY_DN2757_c0_g1_i5:109-2217(+)